MTKAIITMAKKEALKLFKYSNETNRDLGDPEVTLEEHIDWLKNEVENSGENSRLGYEALLEATLLLLED